MSEVKRVLVAHPQTLAARGRPGGPGPTASWRAIGERDVSQQTDVGVLLVRSLMRAQLRLAVRMTALMAFLLGGLPVLFATAPSVSRVRVLGLPLPWLVLGILVYPMFLLVGALYVRLAERNEHDFLDVLAER